MTAFDEREASISAHAALLPKTAYFGPHTLDHAEAYVAKPGQEFL